MANKGMKGSKTSAYGKGGAMPMKEEMGEPMKPMMKPMMGKHPKK